MRPEFEHATKIVKPRIRKYRRLPVIAIDRDQTLDENGTIGTTSDLVTGLRASEPTLFVMVGAADFVSYLDSQFAPLAPNAWQWRASSHEREVCRPDGVQLATRVSTLIHFFGWKNGNYHKILDPVCFYGRKLDEVMPGEESLIYRLLQWGVFLRDFCDNNGIEVRTTSGAVGNQFLTDRRFYPMARRKVPAVTNARVREQLPGNYYYLNVPPSTHEYQAEYLDQTRAHHYHARTIELPSADHLYAYGDFQSLSKISFPTISGNFYGLYNLDFEYTGHRPSFHWHGPNELEGIFVYSNELPYYFDLGYRVKGVRAAWGSRFKDTGLAKYAEWAESQLDSYSDALWLKPVLLSTYGTLATRPKCAESIFRIAKVGEPVTIRTGHRKLSGNLITAKRKLEPGIANVMHRGMIEAACRMETVGLAQALTFMGFRVLSIYADAVIVEHDDDKELPLLPEPWRSKGTLNHLKFINQQAFMSGEMTKLPGVSRDILKYRQQSPGISPKYVPLVEALSGGDVFKRIGAR